MTTALFTQWLTQYGDFALFVLLALGIVGLPIPDETLMAFAGVLMAQNKLSIPSTAIAALLGSICGISLSYLLGRKTGYYAVKKFGRYVGITEKKMERAHYWFERIGKWSLPAGYFIPGVRHFTGYIAGTLRLKFALFATFAYVGALLWVSTFLSLGYFVGTKWENILTSIDHKVLYALLIAAVIALLFYFWVRLSNARKSNQYRPTEYETSQFEEKNK